MSRSSQRRAASIDSVIFRGAPERPESANALYPGVVTGAVNMSLIDLGDDFEVPDDGGSRAGGRLVASRPAGRTTMRSVVSGSRLRASARPPIAVVARVSVGLDASVVVLGDEAIVVEIRDERNEISAYRLAGGKLIWTSPLEVLASDVNIVTADGAVIVSMTDMAASGMHTQAFDAGTGAHLWDTPDGLLNLDGHGDLMLRTGDTDRGSIL